MVVMINDVHVSVTMSKPFIISNKFIVQYLPTRVQVPIQDWLRLQLGGDYGTCALLYIIIILQLLPNKYATLIVYYLSFLRKKPQNSSGFSLIINVILE